jgi:histidine triad (HIT) family protein
MQYKENIFTKIVKKELPSEILLENEHFIVINDIKPQGKKHLLIISKKNYIDYIDFLENSTKEEQISINNLILEVCKKYFLKNAKLISNFGKEASQEIFHFHLHVINF